MVFSGQIEFLKGTIIPVESDVSKGLHTFSLIGLPDKSVEESKDRVSAALKNSGFTSPKTKNEKIIISLLPADTKKEGGYFDVAIALSYLLSSGEISFDPTKKMFLGGLSLSGEVLKVKGVLPIIINAKEQGFEEFFIPEENINEVSILEDIKVYKVKTLNQIIEHLNDVKKIERHESEPVFFENEDDIDFAHIKGQENAKRGLLIAASGGHNISLSGAPGTGKSLLGKAFTNILPPLSKDEIIEVTGIHSATTGVNKLLYNRPFRSPHHTASYVSIIGGGSNIKPGEITLAHRGVLFLDEFPEFDRKVLETLRQPLEENIVSVSRAKGSTIFPSNFILVTSMNPCPCGYFETGIKKCICTQSDILKYQKKISGPIMDRIDLWVYVSPVPYENLNEGIKEKESPKLKDTVLRVREIQRKRFEGTTYKTNSDIQAKDIGKMINLEKEALDVLIKSAEKLNLSARSYHRIIKLARTIADIEESDKVEKEHILEALQYRPKSFIL